MLEPITFAATSGGGGGFDMLRRIIADLFHWPPSVVPLVLVVLIFMSVACWYIIAHKAIWYWRQAKASRRFVDAYWAEPNPAELYEMAKGNLDCPEARIFVAGLRELGTLKQRAPKGQGGGFENIERSVRRARADEITRLERMLQFLATTGSTAPFIGLFGTVWGIMEAFAGIGEMDKDANLLTTVTPHIAEALVATAIGLLAAIPAVMAYNYYVRRTRYALTRIDGFGSDYLNTLQRLYFPS